MSLLDYMHPDLSWGTKSYKILEEDDFGTVVEVNHIKYKVFAKRGVSHSISAGSGPVWRCSHPYVSPFTNQLETCNYNPGIENMPPLPEQKCHQCKSLRAVQISNDLESKTILTEDL